MSIYEHVKGLVTTREAAEHYGLKVNRNGMARCPFHDDHHPSMKVDERFHCFGCGADGDVVDFTARLFDMAPYYAAEKLAEDFGGTRTIVYPSRPRSPEKEIHDVLLEMELRLRKQKLLTAPTDRAAPIPKIYADSCLMYDRVVCQADLFSGGTMLEKQSVIDRLSSGVLDRYKAALEKGEIRFDDVFGN